MFNQNTHFVYLFLDRLLFVKMSKNLFRLLFFCTGLLISYCCGFDLKVQSGKSYYISTVIGIVMFELIAKNISLSEKNRI